MTKLSTFASNIDTVYYCPFLWKICYPLKNSQILQPLANSYMATLECSSTFLTLHEKFLSLSALFATNTVSRSHVQLHQLLTSRERLMLSRKSLHFGQQKLLRTHWALPGWSEKTPLTLSVSDFHSVESWSTPGVRDFWKHQLILQRQKFLQEAVTFSYILNSSTIHRMWKILATHNWHSSFIEFTELYIICFTSGVPIFHDPLGDS